MAIQIAELLSAPSSPKRTAIASTSEAPEQSLVETKLVASNGVEGDQFGYPLAVGGNVLVVGAPNATKPSYWVMATASDANNQMGSVTFNWSVAAVVPNLHSERLQDVASLISNAGLTRGQVSSTNNCIDPGTVMTQHPTGGSTAPVGSSVDITVSTCDSDGGHGGGGGGPILPK